jgi:aminoglycoside/choline kinase family phosphotransferase
MESPRRAIVDFVERSHPGSAITRLAGDASTRIFYRIEPRKGDSLIVMDYGEPFTGRSDDMQLNELFRLAALPVAAVIDSCGETGCLVLEDLGDRSLESALPGAPELLDRAVLLAADVARLGTPVLARSARASGPSLDAERFRFEMDFFIEHYLQAHLGRDDPPGDLRRELHALADEAASSPNRVLCHRDFHSRNLMLLPDGSLAMVDIQDARWGPDSYDLASLLRDAYVDIEEERIEPLIGSFISALDEPPDPSSFRRRFDTVSLQRMIKALGTFGYQTAVRGSDRYLGAIRRTTGRLRRLLPGMARFEKLGDLLELGLQSFE